MSPDTATRRRLIRKFVDQDLVRSQAELIDRLASQGHPVTQATVSRDLDAMGAVKVRDEQGLRYRIPDDDRFGPDDRGRGLRRALTEFVETIAASGNLIVLRTPPGAAHLVASAIDGARLDGVLGTVAGDDTLLMVVDEAMGSAQLVVKLEEIGAG